jgi:hypothetical protein
MPQIPVLSELSRCSGTNIVDIQSTVAFAAFATVAHVSVSTQIEGLQVARRALPGMMRTQLGFCRNRHAMEG